MDEKRQTDSKVMNGDRQTDRWMKRKKQRQPDKWRERQMDEEIGSYTDGFKDRLTDG